MKLSIKEYMESRNVSRRTIYNRIENGQLVTIKENNKTYIISENINKNTKKLTNNSLDTNLNGLKENFLLLESIHNKILEFDYNFLKTRLSAIEKSLVNFVIDSEKSNKNINDKTTKFNDELTQKIDNLISQNNKFLNNFLLVNEQNNVFFLEKFEFLENKLNSLENKIELLENFFKENDKKTFGFFKK